MQIDPETLDPDPIAQFLRWYDDAAAAGVAQREAMTLATAGADGAPAARMVLLRGVDEHGFVFYTNLASDKAADLAANPRAALVFHWPELERQVRVTGPITRVDDAQARAYWATRPRGHRIGAWASHQSRPVGPGEVAAAFAAAEARFAGEDPPLPPFWGGFRVAPAEVEFWQGRRDRLHDRVRYRLSGNGHERFMLAP